MAALYGASVPEAASLSSRGRGKPCSVCGLIKRYIMNRVAHDHGYDVIATGHNLDDDIPMPGLIIANPRGIAKQGLEVLALYTSEQVAWTATNALRADLAAHLLRLDLGFHKAHTPGELIERIEAVTAEDVRQTANEFFRTEQIAVTVLGNLHGLKLTRDQLAC